MPEIKHQFTGGKMNKDVDERLVPNGEYRDAMNIQVSTSEGSEVGTVQNILGNREISSCIIPELKEHCVASIADEKNDVGYYLIASSNTKTDWDGISAITPHSASVEIVGVATSGGGSGSSMAPVSLLDSSGNPIGIIRLMKNTYTNPNPSNPNYPI